MSSKSKRVNTIVSHLKGVKKATHGKGRDIENRANSLFAKHNNPGRHEIVGEVQDTDYLIHLEGPAPLSVEYGREGYITKDGHSVGPMEGLRILGRAVES